MNGLLAAPDSSRIVTPPTRSVPRPHFLTPRLLLAAATLLLFFARIDVPLMEPQEPRYAEIPRQMLRDDSWLTPVLHGQPYLDKPPLLYWAVMGCYAVFGVHDWAARLVPGLAGALTVLLTWWWGRRAVGERAGLFGAAVLVLSARFVYLGRILTFDTLLCLWVTAALATAHVFLLTRRRRWWLLSALACGFGVLTKGPVAGVLVGVPVLIMPYFDRKLCRPGIADWLVYLAGVLGVAGPWFAAVMVRHPGFAQDFFWRHHVQRFLEPFDHQEPFWFHLPGVVLGMMPWMLLAPGLVRHLRQGGLSRRPALGFFLAAAGWGLLFFSLSGCKRAVYVLPALPPLALALGTYFDAVGITAARRATQGVLIVGAGGTIAAAVSGLLSWPVAAALASLHLAALLMTWRCHCLTWAHAGGATCGVLLLAVVVILPPYHERFALRECVLDCRAAASEPGVKVMCYQRSWDSVSFYLGRDDVLIFGADQEEAMRAELERSPRVLVFFKTGRSGEALRRALPASRRLVPERRVGFVEAAWIVPDQTHQ
jgi:4-amino-4-deoxy-L-arabinose transferase-like glycosyltransferase